MFKKPFKVKSQVQLKSSEKKKFSNDVKSLFPSLTDDDASQFASSKDNINKLKIITHSEEIVDVYLVDKTPMFFEVVDAKVKLPTIYMCWKFPHIVPKFTTNSMVLDKLKNGADLFLPGVFLDTEDFYESNFHVKDAAAVNTNSNSAVVAVGQCLMSKSDVLSESSMLDGRLLRIYHAVGDFLCKIHPQPVPCLEPPAKPREETFEEEVIAGKVPDLSELSVTNGPIDDAGEESTKEAQEEPAAEVATQMSPAEERDHMDQLLTYCFIKAAKTAPATVYPILPAAFYANHILQAVPPGETLNVKKTKWKKLSVLLQEMATSGLVKLETIRQNEFRIVSVNKSNELIRTFVDPHRTPVTVDASPSPHAATTVQEVFVVSAVTQPIFAAHSLQKGDEVTRVDVRTAMTEYVKREGLVEPSSPDRVRLNGVLSGIFKGNAPETLTRIELLGAILAAMPLRHKVSSGDGGDLIVHKANLPLIEYEVVKRSGNKKVTLISNIESYGVDVAAFAKNLQHLAAASTSVTSNVPGKKGPQVQVQGNQILIAARVLSENHGIAEKYMRGLEKAPKSKKK